MRPLVIFLPLVAASALKGHRLARDNRDEILIPILISSLDAAAAVGLLVAGIEGNVNHIALCVGGAVLPTVGAVFHDWIKTHRYIKNATAIISAALCIWGAALCVSDAEDDNKQAAALAFASLFPCAAFLSFNFKEKI